MPLKIKRHFTSTEHPYDLIEWGLRTVTIVGKGDDGKPRIVFEQKDVEFPVSTKPTQWSQQACSIVAQKYFRGALGTPEREHSLKQLIDRVVNAITGWGLKDGYFQSEEDAGTFKGELTHLLVNQKMSFNSPVWFNVGVEAEPQCSACFINSVEDSMESILTLAKTEGMLFKFGSGTGTNLSPLRSSREAVRGGGQASGPVSFMRGFDAFAGVIKSGGKVRRAAKMVILNVEHPDIVEYIHCKATEEKKAWALIDAGYDGSFNGEAYNSIFFQNSNNSVRVKDDFMNAVIQDSDWQTYGVTTGAVVDTYRARDLWQQISEAAHQCGDPGLQFDTTINAWHTCPNSGRINASNPCQPDFATVLTPEGIRTFADIEVGSTIWSGKQWTKVTRKVHTGTKPVNVYRTTAGAFAGTELHRVIQNGKRIEAKDAHAIDSSCGPIFSNECGDTGRLTAAMMDGWVLGDGSVHKASGNLVLLDIGAKDQDIFNELSSLITVKRPGIGTYAHEIRTSLTAKELPPTYRRKVPNRFLTAPQAVMCAFLRGLYSANGSICGDRVTLKAASFMVISDVQQMLSAIGITSYVTTNKEHEVEFSNGPYICKQSYDLNITTGRKLFRELIGFCQKDKQTRLDSACKIGASSRKKTTWDIVNVTHIGDFPVYDITVDAPEHTYWTGGLLVSNCSEYMFLDDSACNLASLNLRKFQLPVGHAQAGEFDTDSFARAVDLAVLAQEIIVDNARYPTERITENSRRFRPLGLGYANLGALLMSRGLPYDSEAGRAYAAAITAIMGGRAYRMSATIAKNHGGPFEVYNENRAPFLSVMRKHRQHVDHIDSALCPYDLLQAARKSWDEAIALGEQHGFRNAQVTVLAPTGTIGFMMDCDTTGIEPDIALVKYKHLVGGGTLKITNQTVSEALSRLGYREPVRKQIIDYISEHDTIEGAPHLRAEYLPVFDCAFRPQNGVRSIAPMGHLRMMAACQPFLSGAISKTVNCPNDATVEDIEEIYMQAWKMGLKSIAIYRDSCKRSQPVVTGRTDAAGSVATVVAPPLNVPAASLVGQRRKLPDERQSITHKFQVGEHEGYVHVGLYPDGTPGEVFINMAKEGSTISGLMDSFAIAVSCGLQYGVPLELLVRKFERTRFEPSGWTGNPDIGHASSVLDYLFRWLRLRFLSGSEQVDPGGEQLAVSASDAPYCGECGSQMVRSGACHKCQNCGATSGCS